MAETNKERSALLKQHAERALAEAEARRKVLQDNGLPKEIKGRGGLDPVRYQDWEIKGLACDF